MLLPGEDTIGKHLRPEWGVHPWRTVVRQYRMAAELPACLSRVLYMPCSQAVGNDRQLPSSMTLLLGSGGDPRYVADKLRQQVAKSDPNVLVGKVQTMDGVVARRSRRNVR